MDIFQMAAPATKEVAGVNWSALSLGDLCRIVARFPVLVKASQGVKVDAMTLLLAAPGALAAVMAASSGHPGDQKAEAICDRLAVQTQMEILDAIVDMSFEGGVGPFVELASLVARLIVYARPTPDETAAAAADPAAAAPSSTLAEPSPTPSTN